MDGDTSGGKVLGVGGYDHHIVCSRRHFQFYLAEVGQRAVLAHHVAGVFTLYGYQSNLKFGKLLGVLKRCGGGVTVLVTSVPMSVVSVSKHEMVTSCLETGNDVDDSETMLSLVQLPSRATPETSPRRRVL